MKLKFFVLILLIILIAPVLAHQPRLPEDELTIIENPEISQAFYSELKGKPHYYEINSNETFNLYVGILVPAIENIDKDVSVKISYNNEFYKLLNASESEWPEFFEEFVGDLYYWGPELGANAALETPRGIQVSPGTYTFEVFSEDNQGKYVFVVGEKEEFPLNEMLNSLVLMPKIKKFFNKSPLTAYFNRIGLFLLIFIIILAAIIFTAFYLIRKFKKKKK